MCFKFKKKEVTIIGGTGFLGSHLISFLSKNNNIALTVLVHKNCKLNNLYPNVKFVRGDCLDQSSLEKVFSEKCTVLNLSFIRKSNNIALQNIANLCNKFNVDKLIHVSTAIVNGRSLDTVITEKTPCYPKSQYEKLKYEAEFFLKKKLLNTINLIILRPTEIFGKNSNNLIKNLKFLKNRNIFFNFIKSCVVGKRRMNLVSVQNVVAALFFLISSETIKNEIFIISDDDDKYNNYREIESIFFRKLNKNYLIKPFNFHPLILGALLFLMDKSNINPNKIYCDYKLTSAGFKKPNKFKSSINNYIDWLLSKGMI